MSTPVIARALVTGASGFTGRYVREELEAHAIEVVGVQSAHGDAPDDARVDLEDASRLAALIREIRPDVIVHLAAIAFVGYGDANAFYRVNLLGTRNLLEAAAASPTPPRHVLLASSANVYGNASEGLLDESSPTVPENDYAVSKLSMEAMARLWASRLPITIMRPFNYTGLGQAENFVVPKIVAHFKTRSPAIELGNIDVWRDFSDVRDVARYYRLLIGREEALGRTLNVSSGDVHSLRDVIAMCESLTGHHIDVRVNSAFIRDHEVRSLAGDNSALVRTVGWKASRKLEETLSWMLQD